MVSKEIMENIDLEEGKIKVNGKWLTEDEIRYAIKMKVDSDDYNVADYAVALRTLINEMNKSTILKVRVPREMAEEFEKISDERGESVESMLRGILIDYMSREGEIADRFVGEEREVLADTDIVPSEERTEADIDIAEEEEEEVGLEGEDVHEVIEDAEIEDRLLDIKGEETDSDSEELDIEEDLEEEISDVEVIDEDITEPDIDEVELEEDLGHEIEEEMMDEDEIEAETGSDELEEIRLEEPEIGEDLKEEIPEAELVEGEETKAGSKAEKKRPKKKRAIKKKFVLRKRKLRSEKG